MKKILCLLLCTAMILSFCACTAAPAEQTPASTPVSTPEPTPSPTSEPTPTPEPTLSPEEIEAAKYMEEYEKLKAYSENYGDEYAAFLIKKMYDQGKISEDMFYDVDSYLIDSNDAGNWAFIEDVYGQWCRILNGTSETLSPSTVDNTLGELQNMAWEGKTYISVFDSEEKRNRVENGIKIINEWCKTPTDETRIKMEDMFFSEGLTAGEIEVLMMWALTNPNYLENVTVDGNTYDRRDYFSMNIERFGKSLGYRHMEAYEELVKLNNTPNSKKDWLTESEEN